MLWIKVHRITWRLEKRLRAVTILTTGNFTEPKFIEISLRLSEKKLLLLRRELFDFESK